MEFCSQCDNMLYLRTNEDEKKTLTYFCKHCGFEETKATNSNNSCVYEIDYQTSNYAIHTILNEYTHADPTLPRVNNIECPDENCKVKNKQICYIKYDKTNMKYIYLCCDCKVAWKIIGVEKNIEKIPYLNDKRMTFEEFQKKSISKE